MDTLGRTTLTLTAMNVIDEARDTELIVSAPNTSLQILSFLLPCLLHGKRDDILTNVFPGSAAGNIYLSIPRRLPQTHHHLLQRHGRLRDRVGDWEIGCQYREERGGGVSERREGGFSIFVYYRLPSTGPK